MMAFHRVWHSNLADAGALVARNWEASRKLARELLVSSGTVSGAELTRNLTGKRFKSPPLAGLGRCQLR
jgi:hypothetical protein